jgi:hypothetical protein
LPHDPLGEIEALLSLGLHLSQPRRLLTERGHIGTQLGVNPSRSQPAMGNPDRRERRREHRQERVKGAIHTMDGIGPAKVSEGVARSRRHCG